MPVVELLDRPGMVPFIRVRGNHYEIGYDVGHAFSKMIQSYLEKHTDLNQHLIPLYETKEGRAVYEDTLAAMTRLYPQYVTELQGTAKGAEVPFHKLFLLHLDDILPGALGKFVERRNCSSSCQLSRDNGGGCSTVCVNFPEKAILGHNEDALTETLNHFYILSAHVVGEEQEEKFTSLCYAGNLPGFTLSHNSFGLVFTVNIIAVSSPKSGRTPRTFLTRALLTAKNLKQFEDIVTNSGLGIGNGVSLNVAFPMESPLMFYNMEAGPGATKEETLIHVLPIKSGQHHFHCNKYLRLEVPEVKGLCVESSNRRHKAMEVLPEPKETMDVLNILGNDSDETHPIYRTGKCRFVSTIATAIYNCTDMTLSIYTGNPKLGEPSMVMPLAL